ncbi:DNA repair protein RadC [Vibrio sp. TBV020]|uniref:RadC family protein n=1 Tax=Vibrio sp. TBV020 TaxID=3137398 RepID=UPI0038CDBA73
MNQHALEPYPLNPPVTRHQVLEAAASILQEQFVRGDVFTSPNTVKEFVAFKLASKEQEVFAVLYLDNQHRLIQYEELFFGTIDAASIYPREVIKKVLANNAAAVILAHNHPSGVAEPSTSDKHITTKLVDALNVIEVRVLDHIITGEECVSFAERGLL